MVTGRERLEQGAGGREAGGEAEAVLAAFERSEVALEREARRVMRARVLVALILAERLLGVCRGLVDRHHHRAGGGIGILPGVDRAGSESGVGRQGRVAAHHSPPAMNWSMS